MRSALAGISAFASAYLISGTVQLPVPVYDPVAHHLFVARAVSGATFRYGGDLLVACVAGAVAAAVSRRLRPRASLAVAAGGALSLVALDVLFYLSRLLASL
jgi:hypothetical protein